MPIECVQADWWQYAAATSETAPALPKTTPNTSGLGAKSFRISPKLEWRRLGVEEDAWIYGNLTHGYMHMEKIRGRREEKEEEEEEEEK
eukprot:7080613-Pyramimonas_sp.AAC.1